jgi:D-tyrosyl-tRNA(Tyr) deacylase
MRTVIQRVSRAQVSVAEEVRGSIGPGLLVFLGVEADDSVEDRLWLVDKLPRIRCFNDDHGRMNRSLEDIGGEVMVISQFTLFGTLRKGTRPSFNRAAEPPIARAFYEAFVDELGKHLGRPVPTGAFGQEMKIEALNDGPVTLVIDTRRKDF